MQVVSERGDDVAGRRTHGRSRCGPSTSTKNSRTRCAFVSARDLASVRELNPELQSFRDWLSSHAGEIRV
ncbi:hypothetical protein [Mycolicibacterium parafortuitum]|uniref:hypothetical protein n=1 Tax=Mycolicibacterium parafortuitum TaxID=39692 RepID=UPI0010556425|nr:hypothetical protein [Mycolicibacterium parafortuitum]